MLTERFEYLTTLLAKPETEFKSINLWDWLEGSDSGYLGFNRPTWG